MLIFLIAPFAYAADEYQTYHPPKPKQAAPERIKYDIGLPERYTSEEREHFVFYYSAKGERRARPIINLARSAYREMADILGAKPKGKISVYIAATSADFHRMQPNKNRVPDWAVGLAYSWMKVIYVRLSDKMGNPVNARQTFKHELSHVMLHHATNMATIPKWFNEGFAQWQAKQFRIDRVKRLSFAAFTNSLIPLDDLQKRFPRSRMDIHLAYDQSLDFVSFLVGEFSKTRFHRFIKMLGEKEPFDIALENAFAMPLHEMEKKWRNSLRLSYAWLPMITSGVAVWAFASVLFIVGYFKRRKDKAKRLAAMEKEELEAWKELLAKESFGYQKGDRAKRTDILPPKTNPNAEHSFSDNLPNEDKTADTPDEEDDDDDDEPKPWLH